jgi:hypothetical protein
VVHADLVKGKNSCGANRVVESKIQPALCVGHKVAPANDKPNGTGAKSLKSIQTLFKACTHSPI